MGNLGCVGICQIYRATLNDVQRTHGFTVSPSHPYHSPAEAPPGVVRPGVLRGRHRAAGVRNVVQRPGRVLEEGGAEPVGGEGAPPTGHPAG
ncbi:hypothetical protein CEXT_324201 [Caerostris extrusa]|uniref:Uncharacterized protein n=1 Tax=Caerostris extrusa TaxID=172846 RepID=A0AAV4QQW1_CAEEX|nr:hypothetical protein CEXT_324201 [Caerostris extrusa]